MKLTGIYYLHEIGSKKNQEDFIWPEAGNAFPDSKIFIVCDGVGGSENGEIASRTIAQYMGETLADTPPSNINLALVNALLAAAKRQMVAYASTQGLSKDMATTFTLLSFVNGKAFIAWCGDSRVYHIRNGEVLYRTSDHSLVNTLVKKGEITEEEALLHPQKHIILKAISGDDAIPEAEGHWIEDIRSGDYFLLCTDGLLENIGDTDLKELLTEPVGSKTDIAAMMQQRCAGKTRDNYSMYLVRVGIAGIYDAAPAGTKRKGLAAVGMLVIALVVGGIWFAFTHSREKPAGMESPPIADSSALIRDTSVAKHDTILQPGKNAVPDSELLKEEESENKIAPEPLPDMKKASDSAGRKPATGLKKADSLTKEKPKH